jgi:hypothetical protein
MRCLESLRDSLSICLQEICFGYITRSGDGVFQNAPFRRREKISPIFRVMEKVAGSQLR